MANYIPPENNSKKFTCPHCNTVAQMIYFSASWKEAKSWWCTPLGVWSCRTGKIDTMIGNLVKNGLPTTVQKALDAVRVIGNKAVHPGQIAFDVDDKSTAETLMKLLNIISERLITEPKEIDGIFDALPQSVKDSIEKRDK